MPDSIDQKTAQQVAKLSRIHLSNEEVVDAQTQLSKILDYISQLDQVEMPADIEPFFGAVEAVNAVRDDKTAASFPRDLILKNAPDTDGEFYRVPPVF